MGIGKLLSFTRVPDGDAKYSDAKVDSGGGANIEGEHFSAPGEDAYPLSADYVVTVEVQRSGGEVVVGYIDPKNDSKAAAGEKRIYARDGDGASIVEVWLKNDGTAVISNANGSLTLHPSGEFNINGARITVAGDVVTAGGVSLDSHPHEQGNDSGGDAQVPTDPPTATE